MKENVQILVNQAGGLIDVEMVTASVNFWFNDHEEIRCPFPAYIKKDLIANSINNYSNWVKHLSPEAVKEINEEIHLEKFEEILFENALKLCITDDERISVKYPFMPRLEDSIEHEGKKGKVQSRIIVTNQNGTFLDLEVQNSDDGQKWNTSFELTE